MLHCSERGLKGFIDVYLIFSCVSGVTFPSPSAFCVSPYFLSDSNGLFGFKDVTNRHVLKVAMLVRRNGGRAPHA